MQLTLKFSSIIPFSRADKATIGLIVEPGEYIPERVLLINGFKGIVVVDEAYIDFSSQESLISLINDNNNFCQ